MKLGTITVKKDGRVVVKDTDKRRSVFAGRHVLVASVDEDGDPQLVPLDLANPDHLLQLASTQFLDDKAVKPVDAKAEWAPPSLAVEVKQDKDKDGQAVPGKFNIFGA